MKKVPNLRGPAPTVLSCLAVIGVAATAVMAGKASIKAFQLLEEKKQEGLSKIEKLKTVAPVYIPACSIAVATIGCIFGANALNKKRQTCILGAFTLVDQMYRDYQRKARELYGENVDQNIKASLAEERFETGAPTETDSDRYLFYDELSDRYFWRTMREVMDAEYHLNRNLALRDYASLNEFYEFLGLPPTTDGEKLGWNLYIGPEIYGYSWVDFYHELHDDTDDPDAPSYYAIHIPFAPHQGFTEY